VSDPHAYDVFGAVPEPGDEEAYLRVAYPEYFTEEPHEGGWDECACCPLPDENETEIPHAE
jgi:hypothetical protein